MFGMSQGLYLETVNEQQQPNRLYDKSLDQERYFFGVGKRRAELYHGVELVLVFIRVPVYRHHSQKHQGNGQHSQQVLILEQLENVSFLSGGVCCVRVDQSQASENVDEVDGAIQSIVEHPVNILRPVEAPRKVIVNIQQRV